MRLSLEFGIKYNFLPVEYRKIFISYCKKTLTLCNNGKYFEDYYKDTMEKPYTFAVNFKNPKFSKDKVHFEGNKLRMFFSVSNENRATGLIICNAFLNMRGRQFKLPEGNEMTLINVRKLDEKIITTERALLRTVAGSSIIVKDHYVESNKDRYYTIEDDEYISKLEEKVKVQCEKAGYSQDEIDKIKVNNVDGRKVVTKNYNIYIDGTTGVFDISATPEILQFIYTVGVGSKRSAGYSFVDLV